MRNKKFSDILKKTDSPKRFNDLCDQFFNFNYESIESNILSNSNLSETYTGENLLESALNTSWYDYFQLMNYLREREIILLDLGASYCKGSLISSLFNFNNIYSVEIVEERINFAKAIAKKKKLNQDLFISGDALKRDLSPYDAFYIYQPVGPLLNALLNKVTEEKTAKKILSIESHGDLINRMSFDNRLIKKETLFKFTSSRLDSNLYQFEISQFKKRSELELEDLFYQSHTVKVQSKNPIHGEFTWVTKLNQSDIDYLDGTPCINLNGRRFNLESTMDKIIEFSPKLTSFQEKFIDKKEIAFNGVEQRVLKILALPEEGLELSSSNFVSKKDLD